MAELGPVELLFVEFPGNQFTGEIIPALSELVEQGTIRVIDLVFVAKDGDGNAVGIELEDLPSDSKGAFSELVETLESLISDEDVEGLDTRVTILWFTEGDSLAAWDEFAGAGARVEATGLGRVELMAPFTPTFPGTDRYVDELRE